jgi:hypothetical protein
MEGTIFLTLDQVLWLHAPQIEQFGGSDGVRDMQLIESANNPPVAARRCVDVNPGNLCALCRL